MITVLAFVVVAGAGTLARAEAGRRWNRTRWPSGTIVVNVVGSFLLGVLHELHAPASTVLAVGGLGAFTTFSSFSRDAVALVERRDVLRAVGYVMLTLAASIVAAWLGLLLA